MRDAPRAHGAVRGPLRPGHGLRRAAARRAGRAVGGPAARVLADAAVRAGMAAASVAYYATSDQAASAAAATLRAGDLLLVKGSRGIKTDRVVDRLKSEWGG